LEAATDSGGIKDMKTNRPENRKSTVQLSANMRNQGGNFGFKAGSKPGAPAGPAIDRVPAGVHDRSTACRRWDARTLRQPGLPTAQLANAIAAHPADGSPVCCNAFRHASSSAFRFQS
jgi:hypothetical protein